MTGWDDGMTLGEARDWLRERIEDGEECPCCRQFAKVYRRRLYATMAHELILCWRAGGTDWFYLPDTIQRGGDVAKCRYWGLMQEAEGVRDDGSSRHGWWRVTDVGQRFVRGQTSVMSHARIYDGRCLGLVGEPITIQEALGQRFDYAELMAGVSPVDPEPTLF